MFFCVYLQAFCILHIFYHPFALCCAINSVVLVLMQAPYAAWSSVSCHCRCRCTSVTKTNLCTFSCSLGRAQSWEMLLLVMTFLLFLFIMLGGHMLYCYFTEVIFRPSFFKTGFFFCKLCHNIYEQSRHTNFHNNFHASSGAVWVRQLKKCWFETSGHLR